VTEYLKKTPFSSKPATENYRNGWDAIFGAKAPTEPAPPQDAPLAPLDRSAELAALFQGDERECATCEHLGQDADATHYCQAVNPPWGQSLIGGRPTECGPDLKLWQLRKVGDR